MWRLVLGLGLLCCALFPASVGAEGSARAGNAAMTSITANLRLPAGKGLQAELEAAAVGSRTAVTLTVTKGSRFVNYQVDGMVAKRRFEADFGGLGHVSLRFVPTGTVPSDHPPGPGCALDVTRRGFFVGTARFTGERDYVSIDAHRVKGTVRVERGKRCSDPAAQSRADTKPSPPETKPSLPETASLRAIAPNPGGLRLFIANGTVDRRTHRHDTRFIAGLIEHSGEMTIGRFATGASKRPGSYVFDLDAGTATVRPPAPFRGRASFVRRGGPKHPGRWRGNLSVPLLGHDPIRLTGSDFLTLLNKRIAEEA